MGRARVRPLRVRPGTEFECRGDGLCCADVHLWGPLTRREAAMLRMIAPETVVRRPQDGSPVLAPTPAGRCVLFDDGCRLHATLGPMGKPATCRRFPLALTATPAGGRVGTSHRCSCRLMPSARVLTAEDAEPSLLDPSGRLRADRRVDRGVPLDDRRSVSFAQWERLEADVLARLGREEPEEVLAREPFAAGTEPVWRELGEALIRDEPATRYHAALHWFGDALLARFAGREPPPRARPWADAFDRAEEHAPVRTPREVLADWVADDIWGLEWLDGGNYAQLRRVLAVRVAVARDVARRMAAEGLRGDRAMAEAVLVADLTGTSDEWGRAVARICP